MGGRRKKLLVVARLFHSDTAKYGRSCTDCRTWKYESSGRVALDRTKRLPSGELDPDAWMPMPAGVDPPCHDCGKTVGLRVRHWKHAPDPEWWHYKAFRHHQKCRAVNWAGPDAADPIVRRNAELFRMAEDAAASEDQAGMLVTLGLLTKRGRG